MQPETGRLERSHLQDPSVPRPVLIAIGLLLAATFALVATVRLTADPNAPDAYASIATEPIQAEVSLLFRDRADGAVVGVDPETGETLAVVAPETGGFVRGVMRGLARERRKFGIGADVPFRLVLQGDGDFYLQDRATRTAIDLRAFGPTNMQAFAVMLPREG
jgi:putative photosynthetic complex assembly protein